MSDNAAHKIKSLDPIDIKREVEKLARRSARTDTGFFRHPTDQGNKSAFFDPYTSTQNSYGGLRTADGQLNREVDCRILRRVSKKAWIINVCISHIIKRIKPFLKPSTDRNYRGYVIHRIGENVRDVASRKTKEREIVEKFLQNTGYDEDSSRDSFVKYCLKIIRDCLEIDQVATEIGYTVAGKPYAFWAVDGATIEKVLPDQDNPDRIRYIQIVNGIPTAFYPEGHLIFDYQNPRTDIDHSFYGYSAVEQVIDLITSTINTFIYNAGYFNENKLPKGMLLIDGNASQETVEQMEEYLYDIMSGSPANQWRIPIIPSGNGKSGDSNTIKWVQLGGNNREMEFKEWFDFLTSGVVAQFGCSMEELGLHSAKSQAMFEHNTSPEIEASKSLVLGDILAFLQQYLNRIIAIAFPGYELEFVGYERDDPKAILDITKGELESYKTLNEVRKEKGLKLIEADWADKCPANPQFVQMYQASQMQDGAGGMPGMDDVDMGDNPDIDSGDEDTTGDTEGVTEVGKNGDNGGLDGTDSEAWGKVEDKAEIGKSITYML